MRILPYTVLVPLLTSMFLACASDKDSANEPDSPLTASHYAIIEATPALITPPAFISNNDSVPQIIRFEIEAIQDILNYSAEKYSPPANATRTTTEIDIEYASQRRAERDFLVYYWQPESTRLARQLSANAEREAYVLELFERPPNTAGNTFLPELKGTYSSDFTAADLVVYSSFAVGDGIVNAAEVATLSWQPSEDNEQAIEYQHQANKVGSSLTLGANGAGSLNQSYQNKVLEANWNNQGVGTYTVYNESGFPIRNGTL